MQHQCFRRFGFRLLTGLLLVWLSFSGLSAQTTANLNFLHSARKKVVVPFTFVQNLIIIPLSINGSKPLNFIVDTGVATALLTDVSSIDSLQLLHPSPLEIQGLGAGEDMQALRSEGNRLEFAGIAGDSLEVNVLLTDLFKLSTRLGMEVHGLIGYDLFRDFVVEIDYRRQKLTFYVPQFYKVSRKQKVIPLLIENKKAYVNALLEQQPNDTIPVKLVVDNGLSHALSLYLPSDNRLKLPAKTIDAYLGTGLSGHIHGKIGRVQRLQIGSFSLSQVPVSYPDREAIEPALLLGNRNGNLGAEVLKRFKVVFDYRNSRMLLQPNSWFYKPFYYNLSGVELSSPVPGLRYYVISDVTKNSPANVAGLKKGDQLLMLNGSYMKDFELSDLIRIFESKPGRKIELRIKRGTEMLDVKFTLQSPI